MGMFCSYQYVWDHVEMGTALVLQNTRFYKTVLAGNSQLSESKGSVWHFSDQEGHAQQLHSCSSPRTRTIHNSASLCPPEEQVGPSKVAAAVDWDSANRYARCTGMFLHPHFLAFPLLPGVPPLKQKHVTIWFCFAKRKSVKPTHLKIIISSPLVITSRLTQQRCRKSVGENRLMVWKSPAQLQLSYKNVRVALWLDWEKNLLLPGTILIRLLVS